MADRCPFCGTPGETVTADEGTSHFSPRSDADTPLRKAAEAVVRSAEADDDFEGQFADYLVPFEALDALRAALLDPEPR